MGMNVNQIYEVLVPEFFNILKKIKENNEVLSKELVVKYLNENKELKKYFNKQICMTGIDNYKEQLIEFIEKVDDILPDEVITEYENKIKNCNDVCRLYDVTINLLAYVINFLIKVMNTFNKIWDMLKEILKYMEVSNEKLFEILDSSREFFIEEIKNFQDLDKDLKELEENTKLEDDIDKLKEKLFSKLNDIRTNLKEKENVKKKKLNKFDSDVRSVKDDLEKYKRQIKQLQESIKRYKKEAVIDSLTTLYNRNFLEKKLPEEFEKFIRYGSPLSVIMLDIDNFKDVNDTYGHQIGDQVLRYFANVIKNNIRKVDIPFRYGGEEFLILLPHTEIDQAKIVAERIWKDLNETIFKVKNNKLKITASIGVTQAKKEDMVETLIKRVDGLLMRGKQEGKNRVISG